MTVKYLNLKSENEFLIVIDFEKHFNKKTFFFHMKSSKRQVTFFIVDFLVENEFFSAFSAHFLAPSSTLCK